MGLLQTYRNVMGYDYEAPNSRKTRTHKKAQQGC